MSKKRQRIIHFFGLGTRAENSSSSIKRHQGGIEHLLPARVTGWVVSKEEPFYEVRLLVGSSLIARSEINQPRSDVCEQLDYVGNPGFSLSLPSMLPSVDWSQTTRLLALSVDGSCQAELQLLLNPHHTHERLQSLLQSDILGLEGHFDGIVQGALQGWAARRNQHQPAQVWLRTEGHEPIPLVCNQFREEMDRIELTRQCGFRLPLTKLPEHFQGFAIRCSFDRDGLYLLPQNHPILLPKEKQIHAFYHGDPGELASNETETSSDELQTHWEELEMLRLILDEVENKLDIRDREAAEKLTRNRTWIAKLLQPR